MAEITAGLQPQILWNLFENICGIPHGSKNESALAAYLDERAGARGLVVKKDSTGNRCIYVPAAAGREQAPIVVLQAHLDMVCEKNKQVRHDFARDGLQLFTDGQWLKARGTTLGADNGIGVAAAMALALSEDSVHGPLEILLTVDEETGLTGAMGLSEGFVNGRLMLNLDSENSDTVCIGCAGGGGVTSLLDLEWQAVPESMISFEIMLKGLRGGHSGLNIHENRGNAVKLMARLLQALQPHTLLLADFQAGDKHNAIPREAKAVISVSRESVKDVPAVIGQKLGILKKEYPNDTAMDIILTPVGNPKRCVSATTFEKFCNVLLAFPSGVLAMSQVIPGLVETSSNLSSARIRENKIVVHNTPRSSVSVSLEATVDQLCAIAALAGAKNDIEPSYPGWAPNPESKLLAVYEKVFEKLFKKRPVREATHAGLECGIIGRKFPGMDMISMGPDIANCHSPDEAVNIPSVQKFWTVLTCLLDTISQSHD